MTRWSVVTAAWCSIPGAGGVVAGAVTRSTALARQASIPGLIGRAAVFLDSLGNFDRNFSALLSLHRLAVGLRHPVALGHRDALLLGHLRALLGVADVVADGLVEHGALLLGAALRGVLGVAHLVVNGDAFPEKKVSIIKGLYKK